MQSIDNALEPIINTISLNRESLKGLEAATRQAGKDGKESFFFQGHEFVVAYAEYLVEYTYARLGIKPAVTAAQLREARGAT